MNIEIASTFKTKQYSKFLPQVENTERLIRTYVPRARQFINFRDNVRFVIRAIHGNTNGIAYHSENKIEIDPRSLCLRKDETIRCAARRVIETIFHELVHSQQSKEGRLSWVVQDRQWLWNGRSYRDAKSYNEYLNQPWEVEARKVAREVVTKLYPLDKEL